MIKNFKYTLFACSLLLAGCNGFFEKDNTPTPTPLKKISAEVQPRKLWDAKTGSGSQAEALKMNPAIGDRAIFTASNNGLITAINLSNGQTAWSVGTGLSLTSGPGVGNGIVVAGSRKGEIIALNQETGTKAWSANINDEIQASPVISLGEVIIKAVDGHVRALSTKDGHQLWAFQQTEPALILRGSSAPLVTDNHLIVGFASGNLTKLTLRDGHQVWRQTMAIPEGAFAIERMIDIDADPIAFQHRIYAATYQGKISSLDWSTGDILWTHDISSYTGMVADNNTVYITDAKGDVWGFDANSGLVNWRQDQLEARVLSAPASIGNYIVVGDGEGYLHWLNKRDGHVAARVSTGNGINATPLVKNNVLYALNNHGHLVAYTLS